MENTEKLVWRAWMDTRDGIVLAIGAVDRTKCRRRFRGYVPASDREFWVEVPWDEESFRKEA